MPKGEGEMEGLAECIANEDGERQIACAVLFHGKEMYIGNQAKHQLVKNTPNTITGFKNLLGKEFVYQGPRKPTMIIDRTSVAVATVTTWGSSLSPARTQLIVDVGTSSTTTTLLPLRSDLTYRLASHTAPSVGGDLTDTHLVKTLLIRDRVDYTGSINHMRFDLLARLVDEIVYVGGSTSLPGLDEYITVSAHLISEITDPELRAVVTANGENVEVCATTKTLGVLLPDPYDKDDSLGGTWIPIIQKETSLPARCAPRSMESIESVHIDKIKPPKPVYSGHEDNAEEEEDEEEEEVEVKSNQTTKSSYLGLIRLTAKLGVTHQGKGEMAGRTTTTIDVAFIVGVNAGLMKELLRCCRLLERDM
ncbi:hypothetical protein D9756_010083 [Leucocoprinus leucothites]|uniref:Uncharacterized protein n=1 Tax=Leucocoprinus leucothites TaxID=201217 RepID=A0A8H5CRA8_9AGAR|nr:hypothetical protein D9756_010083 [Leucoagaricus leucothites]